MRQGQMVIQLRVVQGGAYTELRLRGAVPTALPTRLVRRLMEILSSWSGWPVALALSVEADTAGWCEFWSDVLSSVPARHLEIRFTLPRRLAAGRRHVC
jgi:hypothetical protein